AEPPRLRVSHGRLRRIVDEREARAGVRLEERQRPRAGRLGATAPGRGEAAGDGEREDRQRETATTNDGTMHGSSSRLKTVSRCSTSRSVASTSASAPAGYA